MTQSFRYSPARYNYLLLKMGIIRVGTLHDFRRSEHRRGIADPQEGKKRVSKHVDHLDVFGADDPNAKMLEHFRAIKLGSDARVTLTNVQLAQTFDHPDCFILCTSTKRSASTMAEFDGADSCVEITNLQFFYEQLTLALNIHVPIVFRGLFKVSYQLREEHWNGQNWGAHPALIKEPVFRNQHEIRAVWTPRFKEHIEPLVVGNYRLTQACQEVHV